MNGENNTPDTGLPPVFPSGLTLGELDLAGGAGFWDEVTRFTALTTLDEVLDRHAEIPFSRIPIYGDGKDDVFIGQSGTARTRSR